MADHVTIIFNGAVWVDAEIAADAELSMSKSGATGAFSIQSGPSAQADAGGKPGGIMGWLSTLGEQAAESSKQQTAQRREELETAPFTPPGGDQGPQDP